MMCGLDWHAARHIPAHMFALQALHTAVKGPRGIPMEVQIKTSSMHELAEYGAAAHWVGAKGHIPL